jgi:hypothetical protein
LLAAEPIREIPELAAAWGQPQLRPATVRQLHQPLAPLAFLIAVSVSFPRAMPTPKCWPFANRTEPTILTVSGERTRTQDFLGINTRARIRPREGDAFDPARAARVAEMAPNVWLGK